METQVRQVSGPEGRVAEALGEMGDDIREATSIFLAQRPQLLRIAYRIVGNVGEAEDVVQEVWIRWQCTDRSVVLNAAAFLVTTTKNLAINVTQSARRRRELSVDAWPSELADHHTTTQADVERRDDVELAFALLMERLSPVERAAYVLREGFAYPYRRISEILHLGVANVRQIVSRAKRRLSSARRVPVDPTARRRLLGAFLAAGRAGDILALEVALTADVAAVRTAALGREAS